MLRVMTPLRVAVLAFAATADMAANRTAIAAAIAQAAGCADLLLTPECALCGYPAATGALTPDSCALAEAEEQLGALAARHRLGLVLGTAGPDGQGGVHNLAVVGGTLPAQRLAKRVLTPPDRAWFVPGPARNLIVTIGAWRVAVGICYEIRQARWWYEAAAAGADAAVVLAHQAGSDPDPGTKAAVLPALHAARAAELAMPLVLANTAAPDRWLDSAAWDARGVCVQRLGEGLMVSELTHRSQLDPWYEVVRRDALRSWIHTEERR